MNPDSRRVGPCRYLATHKPRIDRQPVSFFRCESCGGVFTGWPSENAEPELLCCGKAMEKIKPRPAEELPDGTSLYYDIVGGLNENALRVFWKGSAPKWLYLETFTGGQQMFIDKDMRSPAVFALGGKDAYAYCDKDPCEKCSFRCKNGFVLYALFEDSSLYAMPINQIAPNKVS